MSTPRWTSVTDEKPPEGVLLEVITHGGDQRHLIFERGLWWLPDRSMYVYFTPDLWRVTSSAEGRM